MEAICQRAAGLSRRTRVFRLGDIVTTPLCRIAIIAINSHYM